MTTHVIHDYFLITLQDPRSTVGSTRNRSRFLDFLHIVVATRAARHYGMHLLFFVFLYFFFSYLYRKYQCSDERERHFLELYGWGNTHLHDLFEISYRVSRRNLKNLLRISRPNAKLQVKKKTRYCLS